MLQKNKSVAFQHIQKNSPTPAFFFKFTLFTSTPNTSYYYYCYLIDYRIANERERE